MNHPTLNRVDHVAMVVPDTEAAVAVWRDHLGFPVVHSEVVNQGTVRLTHVDLGNVHLQFVEPLTPDHPLRAWLAAHGPGLHHLCFTVDDVTTAPGAVGASATAAPHQGIQGKRAVFLDRAAFNGLQVELTGA